MLSIPKWILYLFGRFVFLLGVLIDQRACPDGFEEYENNCYYLSPVEKTWDNSRSHCQSLGYNLATITSENLNSFLKNLVKTKAVPHWIGLNDQITEKTFQWTGTKKAFSYGRLLESDPWQSGEPNVTF